jgi:hypothetical protein
MTTNNFPGIGFVTNGRNWNFFQKLAVTATSFGSNSVDGYQPDMIITFPTAMVTFQLEGTGSIQYSFNGITVDGDMNSNTSGTDGYYSESLVFENRVVSCIWFKLISGSPTIRVEAWATR